MSEEAKAESEEATEAKAESEEAAEAESEESASSAATPEESSAESAEIAEEATAEASASSAATPEESSAESAEIAEESTAEAAASSAESSTTAESTPKAEVAASAAPASAWSDAPDPLTRVVGAVWFVLASAALYLLVRRVFELEFGTQNPRILWVIRGAAIVVPGYPALLGLLTLITGRRPRVRYNPLGLPMEAWWYSTLASLTFRELKRVFLHPVAYIVLFVFMVVNGILFVQVLEWYGGAQSARVPSFPNPATHYISTTFFTWLSLILICPALTMRLLSEEDQSGTLELLMTAPVSDTQIVASKFLSMVIYFAFMVSVAHGAYIGILRPYTSGWDWGPPLGAYAGQVLIGAVFVSIGLFTSSLTKNQILAYLMAALALVLFIFGPQIAMSRLDGTEAEWIRPFLTFINIEGNQQKFAQGVVHWKTLVFYVSTSTFFVFLSVRGLESHRWR